MGDYPFHSILAVACCADFSRGWSLRAPESPEIRAQLALPTPRLGARQALWRMGWDSTHGRLSPTAVFKTAALNHSATHPVRAVHVERHAFPQARVASHIGRAGAGQGRRLCGWRRLAEKPGEAPAALSLLVASGINSA